MAMHYLPFRMRWLSRALWLLFPLCVWEVQVMVRAPWWNPQWKALGVASVTAFLILFMMNVLVRRGAPRFDRLFFVVAVGWSLLSFWVSFREENMSLAFYSVLVSGVFCALGVWTFREWDRSYFRSRVKWYQGKPKMIAGLQVEIEGAELGVARMDEEGAYLVTSKKPDHFGKDEIQARFRYGADQMEVLGKITRIQRVGYGLIFSPGTPDHQKTRSDFVERLRGEGHEID